MHYDGVKVREYTPEGRVDDYGYCRCVANGVRLDSGDHHEHGVPEIWLAVTESVTRIGVVKERQRF